MIAIIGAMQEEVNEITALMENKETKTIHSVVFATGLLNQVPVVVLLSGIGKAAAAMTTAMCLENFNVEGIVNIGTAGGLKEQQEVLDVVVSSKVTYHDLDLTVFGYPQSFSNQRFVYEADARYIEAFKTVIGKSRHWIGPVVSGDQFISRREQVDLILKNYPEAICAEMEGAAVAQVAAGYHIPFVILRSLSDITVRNENHITFEEYLIKASQRSARWCYNVLPLLIN